MLKDSNYNNKKKTETKRSKRSTFVHPKLYVRSFVPQIISETTCTVFSFVCMLVRTGNNTCTVISK